MARYIFTALLTVMTTLAGIAGLVYKSNPAIATVCWVCVALFFILALIAATYESLPKPHLVPIGYGRTHNGRIDGLVFVNEGATAYSIQPPEPVAVGNSTVSFLASELSRLSDRNLQQCFPISVRDSLGPESINGLRMSMVLNHIESFSVSFRYADGRKPKLLRYRTICEVAGSTSGIDITLQAVRFNWLRLFG